MGNQPSQPLCRDLEYLKLVNVLPTEIREWSHAFKTLYPDGRISLKKFTEFFTSLFPFGKPEQFCTRLFYNINMHQERDVDLGELLIAFTVLLKGSAFERLRWLYRFYDRDRDGMVSREELEDGFTAINMLTSNTLLAEIPVKELVDGIFLSLNNQSGFLTFNDFETLAQSSPENFKRISSFLDW